jgi:NADH dehydrogenase [ubiquinone] 1 alpha subcomplex assembly factor 5
MSLPPQIFDLALLQQRRQRAAPAVDNHAFLLARVAEDFAERLTLVKRDFETVVEVGAHHGLVGRQLARAFPFKRLISLEGAPALLAMCAGEKRAFASEMLPDDLPLADFAFSALSLHLINDLPGVLSQIRNVLKPDGFLLASLLGGTTLHELRLAWLVAEAELYGGASPRVAPFADVRDLGRLLQRAGFALPVADSDIVTVTYADPLALMRELRGMAASNMLVERSRRPVTRRLLMRAAEVYIEKFALPNGRIPATFEIITLSAWVPHESQQKPLRPGSAQKRLADALGTSETVLPQNADKDEPN